MKKRILSIVLIICISATVLCACSLYTKAPIEVKKPQTTSETPDWKQIYTEFLTNNNGAFSNEYGEYSNICYLGVNDLNFDGTPELILSDDCASAAYSFAIFYIKDSKVQPLFGYSRYLEKEATETNSITPYSTFDNKWLTLRKNANTGEIRYVMYTGNGSSCDSFGNTVSFKSADNGEIEMINELEYLIFYDDSDDDYKPTDSNYYVCGKAVTEDDYNKAEEEFEKTWIDTGVRQCAMSVDFNEYSNKIPISLEKEYLENFFDMYKKEY